MTEVFTLGAVNLATDADYWSTIGSPQEIPLRVVHPRPNSPTNQTAIMSRRQTIQWAIPLEVVCVGASGSYSSARTKFNAIKTELDATQLYWRTKGRSGTNKTLSIGIQDQASPDVWTVQDYSVTRLRPDLEKTGRIWVRFDLLCFEGSATAAGAVLVGTTMTLLPQPVQVRLQIPPPTIQRTVTLTPDPVVITLSLPAPSIARDFVLTPDPVVITLSVPAPTISHVLNLTPDPVVITLNLPAPTVTFGRNLTPDPVVITLVLPEPTVTGGDRESGVLGSDFSGLGNLIPGA